MKNIIKTFLVIAGTALIFAACKKTDSLPYYATGTAPVLSSDVTSFSSTAPDSDKVVINLNWTNPNYATDSSTVKYIVQIDSSGKNFSNPSIYTITGKDTASFTAKDFNYRLLGLGFAFKTKYSVDVRVVSSYSNNNDQKFSNIVTMQVTPYVTPPKVMPPASDSLFIIGGATAGGWNQPVPMPAQQFTKIDSVTYEGTFYFNGTSAYDLLPVNGSWSEKYNVADPTQTNLSSGGVFQYSTGFGSDIPAPSAAGMYTVHVDFQSGTFTVIPVTVYSELFVPGDYQGWDPTKAPALASPASDGNYEGYINVPAGGTYEFKLTNEPDWNGTTYGDGGSGTLSTSGGNLKFSGAGYYKVNASTTDNTWSVMSTTWSLMGSFAASSWSTDVDMIYNAGDNDWTATINTVDGDQFKFRANHDWGLNYGDKGADGTLEAGGDNINISAGSHKITLYLNNAGYYTYKIE